jgi:hypothetical protein
LPGEAAAQQPPRRAAAAAEKAELRVFRLKYMAAPQAARALRELLGEEVGPKGSIRTSVAEGANALLVWAGADQLDRVATIVREIDTEGAGREAGRDAGRPELRVFVLKHAEPDQGLDEALRLVFDGRQPGKFVVDRRLRAVIASGDRNTLEVMEALLTNLDTLSEQKPRAAGVELQVRVFWLTGGPARKDAPGLPDDLKEVAAELAKLGVDKPHLATQVSVSTLPDTRFETSGVAALDASSRLSVAGTVTVRQGKVGLEIAVNVTRMGRGRGPGGDASLRTQVTVPPGRPVVLGVTPTEGLPSAFVVQVVGRKEPPGRPGKAAALEFRAKPWGTVLEWLTDQTGLPVITNTKPTGTFTFVPPGPATKYTVPEIVDIINEGLLAQKLLLIRRDRSFVIVPADERIDPGSLPRLLPDELEKRGKTEFVSVVIPLRTLQAEEIAPEVKKMLGPFGEVIALKKANQLVLQDTAGSLRRIYQLVEDVERQRRTK